MTTLAVIGCGHMATAIVKGLIEAGWDPAKMRLTTRNLDNAKRIAAELGAVATDNNQAAEGADVVLVAVKPGDVGQVLRQISPVLSPETLVISVAVGIPTSLLEASLPANQPVVRVLPNVPAELHLGMSVICPGINTGEQQLAQAEQIFSSIGKTLITDEKYLNVAGALSGSGTGYLFYVAEAMIEAGVTLGLPRKDAEFLTAQSLYGSSAMLARGDHAGQLREAVTSPGGTTAAAFKVFEHFKVRAAFLDAVEATTNRSAELAEQAIVDSQKN